MMDTSISNAASTELTYAEYNNYRRMFRTFDHNNSGRIEQNELFDIMKAMGYDVTKPPEDPLSVTGLMNTIDSGGEGGLDFESFMDVMLTLKESEGHKDAKNIAEEHIRQATATKLFLPDAPWRWCLDVVVFAIILYSAIMVSLGDVRGVTYTPEIVIWESVAAVILLVDTGLNFCTVHPLGEGQETTTIQEATSTYLRTWFAIDFISSLPLDLMFAEEDPQASIVLRNLRLLRVLKMQQLFRTCGNSNHDPSKIFFRARVVPVARLVFYLIVVIHIYTVIWLSLSPDSTYVEAIYLVLYTITTVGLGDIPVVGTAQRIFNCVLFVSGAVVNGFVISKLSQILQKASVQQEKDEKMTEMVSLLRYFNIPRPLQEEILAFQYHQLENDVSTAFKECIEALPPTLQDQLSMYAKLEYVSKLPMCKEAHLECRMALARSMTQAVFSPQEFILCAGEKGTEMYFLTHGFADVLSPEGKFILTLKRGSFFGEYALLDDRPRSASVKALSYCDTLTLDREHFLDIMTRYPSFRQRVTKMMEEKHVPAPKTMLPGMVSTFNGSEAQELQAFTGGRKWSAFEESPPQNANGQLPVSPPLSRFNSDNQNPVEPPVGDVVEPFRNEDVINVVPAPAGTTTFNSSNNSIVSGGAAVEVPSPLLPQHPFLGGGGGTAAKMAESVRSDTIFPPLSIPQQPFSPTSKERETTTHRKSLTTRRRNLISYDGEYGTVFESPAEASKRLNTLTKGFTQMQRDTTNELMSIRLLVQEVLEVCEKQSVPVLSKRFSEQKRPGSPRAHSPAPPGSPGGSHQSTRTLLTIPNELQRASSFVSEDGPLHSIEKNI